MTDEGVTFGRYRLVGLLGRGGMATVYRAYMSGPMGFEKEVALKRLHDEVTEDERLVRSLINEARLGGQLRHPNIVQTYEFDEIAGTYFMALELVQGWPLDAVLRHCRLQDERLPLTVVSEILIQACRGLHHAHELTGRDGSPARLIHRDLKPSNIMISQRGSVKIMDFGVAKAATNLYQTTTAETIKGTPIYMSPEQLMARELDRRSDVYSMGAILHEMVTGRIPFEADSLPGIIFQIVQGDLHECIERMRARYEPLVDVLTSCMAKEPEERFATARELSRALHQLEHTLPPGPTLLEWLEEVGDSLPAAPGIGDFGAPGRPAGLLDDRSGAPRQTTWAGKGSGSDDEADPSADPSGADDSLGEPLSSFFGGPASADPPGRPAAPPTEATDLDTAASEPDLGTAGEPTGRSRTPRAVGLVLLVVGVAGLLLLTRSSTEPDGDEGPVVTAAPIAPARESTSGQALDEGAGSLHVEPTPASAPTPARTPRPVATTPMPMPATPELTRPPEAAAPATVATAEAIINTIPWSEVWIDGEHVGRTMRRLELPVGRHEVRFVCSVCSPDVEQTHPLDVSTGGDNRLIVRFETGPTDAD